MTDPIADMLNQISNAQKVFHPSVRVPFSKLKYEIAHLLNREGFIGKIEKKLRKTKKIIELTLKYNDRVPVINRLKRVSKPSQRIYLPSKKIKQVRSGYGILIISTPQGIMTNKEARRKKLGGEIICEVW